MKMKIKMQIEEPKVNVDGSDVEVNINFFALDYLEGEEKWTLADNVMIMIDKQEIDNALKSNDISEMSQTRKEYYTKVNDVLAGDYSYPSKQTWKALKGVYGKCFEELRSVAVIDAAMAIKSFESEKASSLFA